MKLRTSMLTGLGALLASSFIGAALAADPYTATALRAACAPAARIAPMR